MKHGLFSTPLELEPNQSPEHKQPWKEEMLISRSNVVPKQPVFINPKHCVSSVTPYFSKVWPHAVVPVYNPLFGCESFHVHLGKMGGRGEKGRYSVPLREKGLHLIKLCLYYLHASTTCWFGAENLWIIHTKTCGMSSQVWDPLTGMPSSCEPASLHHCPPSPNLLQSVSTFRCTRS